MKGTAMQDEKWTAVYFGLFGKLLQPDEAEAVEAVIGHVFHAAPPRPWEIGKALYRLSKDAPPGNVRKYAPNGEDIIKAIFANRREYQARKANPTTADGYGPHLCPPPYPSFDPVTATHATSRLVPAQDWQDALRLATTPAERWNLIQLPHAKEHREQRERFCQDKGLAYERYETARLLWPGALEQLSTPVEQHERPRVLADAMGEL